MSAVEVTDVVGGSHGLAVAHERVRALAEDYRAAGERMRAWADEGRRTATDADLLESAVLSPRTFVEAEARVLAATVGPDGLGTAGVAWEADALLLQATVRAFEEADDLARRTIEVLDYALGRAVGFTLAASAPVVLGTVAVVAASGAGAGSALADAAGPLEEWVTEHPDAVQHLVNGAGGLLDGLWDGLTPLTPGGPLGVPTFTPDTESAAGVLASLYGDDGVGVATPVPFRVPAGDQPPADLAGVLDHLDQLHRSGADGTIEVQTLTGADGSVRHVVYLPGTDDLGTLPWTQDTDARDLATNLRLVSGVDNVYQQGILDAMTRAGIRRGEPVLLAGHSQGGMAAAAVLAADGPFTVTDVVTAGSPTAHVGGFPPGSHVLSLEHEGDVVPLLDGEGNADSAEQLTVRFDAPATGVLDHHEIGHYTAAAAALATSTHPSVVDHLRGLHDRGFVGAAEGTTATSQVFCVVREQ